MRPSQQPNTPAREWPTLLLGYFVLALIVGVPAAIFLMSPAPPDPVVVPPSPVAVAPTAGPAHTWGGTLCMDGWVSHSVGRGTCSHHGGER
jgi:hypothetical protein